MANSNDICGEFEEPTFPDHGQCTPKSRTICEELEEVPVEEDAPVNECEDENISLEWNAELTPPFRVIATVFDTNCEPLLDHNGEVITGPTL